MPILVKLRTGLLRETSSLYKKLAIANDIRDSTTSPNRPSTPDATSAADFAAFNPSMIVGMLLNVWISFFTLKWGNKGKFYAMAKAHFPTLNTSESPLAFRSLEIQYLDKSLCHLRLNRDFSCFTTFIVF